MVLVRRVLLLALISISGIALLAPLAARSAATLPTLVADSLLADGGGPVSVLQRGVLSARSASSAAGDGEALQPVTLPTPASVPMEATIQSVAAPPPAVAAAPVVTYAGTSVWDDLARCESGGNWAINTGNGYYGGLQFSLATWQGYGGAAFAAYPYQATRDEQIIVAERLRAARGYAPWPACRAKLGLP